MKSPQNTSAPSPADAPLTDEQVSRVAYSVWEQEGRPDGRALEHWLQAIDQLAQGSSRDLSLADSVEAANSKARVVPPRKLGLIEIAPARGRT